GFAPMLRQLGNDLGFVPLVIGASTTLYALTLLLTLLTTGRVDIVGGGGFSFLAPNQYALRLFGMSGAVPVFEAPQRVLVRSKKREAAAADDVDPIRAAALRHEWCGA